MTKYIYYDVIAMEVQFLHSSAAMTAAPALPVGSGHYRTQNPVWQSFFSPPRFSRLLHDSPVSAMVLPPLPLSLFLGAGGALHALGDALIMRWGARFLRLGVRGRYCHFGYLICDCVDVYCKIYFNLFLFVLVTRPCQLPLSRNSMNHPESSRSNPVR